MSSDSDNDTVVTVTEEFSGRLKNINPRINNYELVAERDRVQERQSMLLRLARYVAGVMQKNDLRVESLRETREVRVASYWGYNLNNGKQISIALRTRTGGPLLDMSSVIDTMLHELAHNTVSEHEQDFYTTYLNYCKDYIVEATPLQWPTYRMPEEAAEARRHGVHWRWQRAPTYLRSSQIPPRDHQWQESQKNTPDYMVWRKYHFGTDTEHWEWTQYQGQYYRVPRKHDSFPEHLNGTSVHHAWYNHHWANNKTIKAPGEAAARDPPAQSGGVFHGHHPASTRSTLQAASSSTTQPYLGLHNPLPNLFHHTQETHTDRASNSANQYTGQLPLHHPLPNPFSARVPQTSRNLLPNPFHHTQQNHANPTASSSTGPRAAAQNIVHRPPQRHPIGRRPPSPRRDTDSEDEEDEDDDDDEEEDASAASDSSSAPENPSGSLFHNVFGRHEREPRRKPTVGERVSGWMRT